MWTLCQWSLASQQGSLKNIRAESRKLLREGLISGRALSRLIGKMNAANKVIPLAPLFYRYLQMDLKGGFEEGGSAVF